MGNFPQIEMIEWYQVAMGATAAVWGICTFRPWLRLHMRKFYVLFTAFTISYICAMIIEAVL